LITIGRDRRLTSMLAHHLRYTFRSFRKNPGFAAIAVLSLALGIGANTAIFSLLDRVLLRSLPVRSPEQLVLFTANGPRRGSVNTQYDDTYTFSYPMYRDFRDRAPGLNGVIAWFPIAASFSLKGTTERVNANLVSGNFFEVLGVGTALGRPITPEDARASGSTPVAVLSYSFWQQRFGGNADVLNQQIDLNGQPLTVVGVAARGFNGVAMGEAPAAFVPVTMKPLLAGRADLESRRAMWLNVMGRLKPGATRQSVEAALNVFWRPILEDEVSAITRTTAAFRQRFVTRRISLADASNGISALRLFFREPLILLMALVGLVLLIACANVANLMIARAAGRQKEIAIRLSVGATRGDIVRQILTESLVLAAAGGAIGIAVATWGGRVLIGFMPFTEITATVSADPDWRILGFTAAVAILCGIFFGLAPALQTTRPDLASTLKEQAGAVVGSGAQVRLRKGLVVAQVALSLLLLTGAGLFLRSLGNLKGVALGFRADHLMSFTIQPALSGYTPPRAIALFDALRQRAAGLPGVRSVAATQTPLLANENWDMGVTVPGYEPKENENAPNVTAVSPGYFAALGMPLAAGREFREGDNAAGPRVAVVNQTFAQVYFGGMNPIGRQFYFTADAQRLPVEIVGVAKDGKYADVREEKQRFVFCPYAQQYNSGIGGMTYYVRTSQDPETLAGALRQAVREADANLPVYNMKTMQRQIEEDVFADRMVSALSAFFGLLATVLAAIGLYGVMSYTVTRRTREIGIRMALGASRRDVLGIVLGEVALLAAIGIAIAAPLSFPLASLAKSMLYGVAPHDAAVLAGAAALLAFTALAAGYIPAARAARVDPLTALRHD
jgi:predicted permease